MSDPSFVDPVLKNTETTRAKPKPTFRTKRIRKLPIQNDKITEINNKLDFLLRASFHQTYLMSKFLKDEEDARTKEREKCW